MNKKNDKRRAIEQTAHDRKWSDRHWYAQQAALSMRLALESFNLAATTVQSSKAGKAMENAEGYWSHAACILLRFRGNLAKFLRLVSDALDEKLVDGTADRRANLQWQDKEYKAAWWDAVCSKVSDGDLDQAKAGSTTARNRLVDQIIRGPSFSEFKRAFERRCPHRLPTSYSVCRSLRRLGLPVSSSKRGRPRKRNAT